MRVALRRSGNVCAVVPTTDQIERVIAPLMSYTETVFHRGQAAAMRRRQGLSLVEEIPWELFDYDFRKRLCFPYGFVDKIYEALQAAGYDVRLRWASEEDELKAAAKEAIYTPDWSRVEDLLKSGFTFRWRQRECLEVVAANENARIDAPTGFGKAEIIMLYCLLFPRAKIAVAVDSVEIAKNRLFPCLSANIPGVGLYGGGVRKEGRRINIYTADSLHHAGHDNDTLIVDECFSADTLVDGVPISQRRVGDLIRAYDEKTGRIEYRKVTNVMSRPAPATLIEIEVSGVKIVTTRLHPFFTKRGWVNAEVLTVSDSVLCDLPGGLRDNEEPKKAAVARHQGVLQPELYASCKSRPPCGQVSGHEPAICPGQDAAEQSDAPGGCSGTAKCDSEGKGVQASSARREWNRADAVRDGLIDGDRAVAAHCQDRARLPGDRVADALQDRFGFAGSEAGDRDRWALASAACTAGTGSEKRGILAWARLDRIAVHERASVGIPCRLCADGKVYNLEVEETHTYLANGVVVHNCHMACADKFASSIMERFADARKYGFSATQDMRLDNKDLRAEAMFGPIRFHMPYQEAVEHDLVLPIEVIWSNVIMDENPCAELKDTEKKRKAYWSNEHRNQKIAKDVALYGDDAQGLITVETIEHALYLHKLTGIEMIYAGQQMTFADIKYYRDMDLLPSSFKVMTEERRAKLTKWFTKGTLRKAIATSVFNFGVNFRHLRVLLRADGGASPINDTQIPGRNSRHALKGVKFVGIVHDYMDQFDWGCGERSKKRQRSYASHGWMQHYPQNMSAKKALIHKLMHEGPTL
jgi:superfamily II DNA or RNA helicase